jgi:diacylglycerol O-acyltransferase
MSNNGQMHIGAIACSELMPRVWDLVDQFPIELEAMQKAVLG